MNQRQLVRWLEKYCINSRIRLTRRQLDQYWMDPKQALKEFDPKENNIDEKIYDFTVNKNAMRFTQGLSSELRYSNTDFFFDEAENDSDSDHDRFGAVKKVPEIHKLVEKWKQPSRATPTDS
jgi:hypothetical protein